MPVCPYDARRTEGLQMAEHEEELDAFSLSAVTLWGPLTLSHPGQHELQGEKLQQGLYQPMAQ